MFHLQIPWVDIEVSVFMGEFTMPDGKEPGESVFEGSDAIGKARLQF